MRIFLVIYNADCSEEVLQTFERMQVEPYPLQEKGRTRTRGPRGHQEKQIWTGTKAMVVLAVAEEKENSLYQALEEINRTHKDAHVRTFAFEPQELL
jgi:hypothetical protein